MKENDKKTHRTLPWKKKGAALTSLRASERMDVYDLEDVTARVDASKPLRFEDIGLSLPDEPPTQVVSIRLPTHLLNRIRALGSQSDVPYQALIKLYLTEAVNRAGRVKKKKTA